MSSRRLWYESLEIVNKLKFFLDSLIMIQKTELSRFLGILIGIDSQAVANSIFYINIQVMKTTPRSLLSH